MPEDHKPLPVSGYTPQSDAKVALVNGFKQDEERLLRQLDALAHGPMVPLAPPTVASGEWHGVEVAEDADKRWIAVARTHFQEGFMALNRAVFQPQRIKLPEDDGNPPGRQTSPEIASLAGKLMDHEDPDVRRLAASALGSVME